MLWPEIPIAPWIDAAVNWIENVFGPFLNAVSDGLHAVIQGITTGVEFVPWWIVTLVIGGLAYLSGKWRLAIGSVVGLLLIYDLQLWDHMIQTLVMVILGAFISVVIGLPLGVLCARRLGAYRVISPILDVMQTMPSFVYLVPVLIFFNIGLVPAIFATIVFAMPPVIRLTRLGILQVNDALIEAARSFGTTDSQLLWKVQLPLAMPSIKAGINQTVMLSLSMVVVSSMIGAGGLGADVMSALETVDVGSGFEAGIAIVILAIILDRISQNLRFGKKKANTN